MGISYEAHHLLNAKAPDTPLASGLETGPEGELIEWVVQSKLARPSGLT